VPRLYAYGQPAKSFEILIPPRKSYCKTPSLIRQNVQGRRRALAAWRCQLDQLNRLAVSGPGLPGWSFDILGLHRSDAAMGKPSASDWPAGLLTAAALYASKERLRTLTGLIVDGIP